MSTPFTTLRQRLTAAGFTTEESVDRFGRPHLIADIGEDEGVAVTQSGDTFAARVYCGTFGKTVYSGRGHVTAEAALDAALDGWRKANAVPLALIAATTLE